MKAKDLNNTDYQVLQEMIAENDTGGRNPKGFAKKLIIFTAILWSLVQIYYVSPFGYTLQPLLHNAGINFNPVIDDSSARAIHLAFAIFLAFLTYPAFNSSSRRKIPFIDWGFAIAGALLALYGIFFYDDLVSRIGNPNTQDIIAGIIGMLLLLEAARRTLGLPLVIIAIIFLFYNYVGQFFPAEWTISHRSGTLSHIINQQWISSEGIFGIALGVSTKYVFLFVLFGALLDKAGAGNYFIQTAFAYLGHFKGGPAKAAVVSSGLTGLISGSSIANVVTTGTFTIPMMKRVGFSNEKAGAVEVASSVNGQIMPPVMGAAAFLMTAYVNIPYSQLVTHAFLPAVISYIALVYIVHLEAMKLNLQGLKRVDPPSPIMLSLIRILGTFITICIIFFALYYGLSWIKEATPEYSLLIILIALLFIYLTLLARVATFPELALDDPEAPIVKLPSAKPTVNSGLHFLIPVVVLIWCLMIEKMSPGLSAFYGTMVLSVILITQKPILHYLREDKTSDIKQDLLAGLKDLKDGLETGARNMISIGIATSTAGIIVGVVALTSLGSSLSGIIETLSMGNILLMLIWVAIFSLILGMGLPTTANYIVVSSLMAAVIVEVGQANGLIVPMIAVHLFVFYFGIMADVTPPVGLASFAAAAISKGDPIKTGLVAFFYSLRTAILPFLFIFNTDLLLIDVGYVKGFIVFVVSTIAILLFTSATMGYFITKNKKWESLVLLLCAFMMFRPGFFMEKLSPSTQTFDAKEFVTEIEKAPANQPFILKVSGEDLGKTITYYAQMNIPDVSPSQRIKELGLELFNEDEKLMIDFVESNSPADKAGLSWDQQIISVALPIDNYSKEWFFIPPLLIAFMIFRRQRRREKEHTQ